MANTLPAPTEGLVYTNPTTGKRIKFSGGCWKPIDYLPLDGSDSMQGTLWTPDQLINGNTLTADSISGGDIDWNGWVGYPSLRASSSWVSVTYGGGKFVKVANSSSSSSNPRIGYSEDGINWTAATANNSSGWIDVGYGDGKFVAVAFSGSTRVSYSEDGVFWSRPSVANHTNDWRGVTYGDGKWVAVARDGTNKVMYSTDGGLNWTPVTSSNESNEWYDVTYGDGKFVAVAFQGTNRVMYSEDGINWTGVPSTNESGYSWLSVTYGNGKFVAVGNQGANRVMYSEDGINWTAATSSNDSNPWQSVRYGNGYFVAVAGSASGTDKVMYSEDGISWTGVKSANEVAYWQSVTYGDGKFVAVANAVGNGGTNADVMVLDAPEGSAAQDLYFNGDPVVIDTGLQESLATLLSTQSRQLGRTRYYQDSALPTGDSYDYPDGSLWYQPTSNNLHFYNDSDQTWVQL
jgi:hypothetical protein